MDDTQIFPVVVHHLTRLGISAPQHVSLACTDSSAAFEGCRPTVTHIAWNDGVLINRVISWADRTSNGKSDRRLTQIRAVLVPGGTIGPVPRFYSSD